ncbi:MAG: GGDEF domain-containing protein [Ruminococcus sp.]|nr:GGDEF domain-containing protein [Ruminococcus sp.]
MDCEKYTLALENFLNIMMFHDDTDLDMIHSAVEPLGKVLRFSRIESYYYENSAIEHIDKGYRTVYYEDGAAGKNSISERFVTNEGNIVVFRLFGCDEGAPWSEEDKQRLYLIVKLLFTFRNRNKLIKIVDNLTYFDQEIGVHNLRYYLRYLGVLHEREQLGGHTAICFNLKRFTAINQKLGRTRGTYVMRAFTNEIAAHLNEGEMICRLVSDNFIMLVKTENAQDIVDALLGQDIVYDSETGAAVHVSANIGVYSITDESHIELASDIMDRISAAAHIARESAEHDVIHFNESMLAVRDRNIKIVTIFPKALENEEFMVYYQPKISMEDYTMTGAEALCRWQHDGKVVSPGDFIPVLERSMEICDLDFYILDHVCQHLRRWIDLGKDPVRISINFSRRHMSDLGLLEHILRIVDKYRVPHGLIEIELTETTSDIEFKDLKRVVKGLQEAGFSTSVDDFGVGYSSLTLIKDIPWDVLKVDKSFLPNEDDNEDRQKRIMFKYVLAMAQEMGLECIAEGVETRDQLDLLKENCCDLAQGFFFDRPLPVSEFEKRLDDKLYVVKS